MSSKSIILHRRSLNNLPDGVCWELSSSSDKRALAVVDGIGKFVSYGPHYSRRTPGSRTFTGVGQEIVLVLNDGTAVWAVVRQRTPSKKGSGSSRGRTGVTDSNARYVWRNMLFRNLGYVQSSALIASALEETIRHWFHRYGTVPQETLRTEIDSSKIRSSNPGCCYKRAGWTFLKRVGSKIYLAAPDLVVDNIASDLEDYAQ